MISRNELIASYEGLLYNQKKKTQALTEHSGFSEETMDKSIITTSCKR